MLSLSDDEMTALMALAAPLLPAQRAAFLEALAAELQARPDEIGLGKISRVGRELLRRFLNAPAHDGA